MAVELTRPTNSDRLNGPKIQKFRSSLTGMHQLVSLDTLWVVEQLLTLAQTLKQLNSTILQLELLCIQQQLKLSPTLTRYSQTTLNCRHLEYLSSLRFIQQEKSIQLLLQNISNQISSNLLQKVVFMLIW